MALRRRGSAPEGPPPPYRLKYSAADAKTQAVSCCVNDDGKEVSAAKPSRALSEVEWRCVLLTWAVSGWSCRSATWT